MAQASLLARFWRPLPSFAAALLTLQSCRSDFSQTTRGTASSPGAAQSAPLVLPADDAALAYKLPSTQRSMDLVHHSLSDGGLSVLPPIALREDSQLPADVLTGRDLIGATLEAEWKAGDWPSPSNAPETDRDRLTELRGATRWSLRFDLASSGRMRLMLRGRGFALESGTELRARLDLLGHFLVWPNESQYRPLSAGCVRPLFEEGRADVGELVTIQSKAAGTGHLLEWDTERTSASTAFGQVTIDRAASLNLGVAGRLVCRWLIEFINGDPASEFCQDDAIPLRAAFEFPSGGKGEFIVSRVIRKQEFAASAISVPPAGASANFRELPRGAQLNGQKLATLRSRATPFDPNKPMVAGVGLLATNHALGLRALLVDGVIAGWLWPGEERDIPELLSGVYSVAWRDFMGISREAPANVTVPAHVTLAATP
jgi:hypothetical protein